MTRPLLAPVTIFELAPDEYAAAAPYLLSVRPNGFNCGQLEADVQPTSHFETLTNRSVLVQARIEALVADLRRLVQAIEANIQTEEERANAFDRAKPDYPDTARRLGVRRDNLMATIDLLERDSVITARSAL